MAECPVCGAALQRGVGPKGLCEHVIARSDGSTLVSPLDGVELPWLSRGAVGKRWPDRQVATAFGELAPLVDEYGALADWRPGMSARVLWPLLAEFLSTPVASVVGESTGHAHEQPLTYWLSPEPARAADEARALVGLLRQGYGYLEGLASDRSTDTRKVA